MSVRLNKVIKEFNIGLNTAVEFLSKKGFKVDSDMNAKIDDAAYNAISTEFGKDVGGKKPVSIKPQTATPKPKKAEPKPAPVVEEIKTVVPEDQLVTFKTVGKVDLNTLSGKGKPEEAVAAEKPAAKSKPEPAEETVQPAMPEPTAPQPEEGEPEVEPADTDRTEPEVFRQVKQQTIEGPKVLGSIDLTSINENTRPKKKSKEERKKERDEKLRQQQAASGGKKKRNRIQPNKVDVNAEAKKVVDDGRGTNSPKVSGSGGRNKRKGGSISLNKNNVSDEEVAKEVKKTLARLQSKKAFASGAKYRREKRDQIREQMEQQATEEANESKTLKLTEFVTANELASMMNVPVTKVISTCMSIGMMISINQRMDAETINMVAEEFGFKTEYVSASVSEAVHEEEDEAEDLQPRDPIVTVMGHVDHGKTSLLDWIRKSNVIAGEAGGITQHIGAYNVTLENGRHITFLDTPGHEAFTAMRARGAQATDIAIIIIAADDDVMPQTKEAISHAQAAGVPMVFAINKIDKPGADPEKVKGSLANMNLLVEDWGGKYQSQDISAKKGIGVNDLLEKVLLEADMLELKANPNRKATGTIIESSLDKGRGYVATILVSNGTLNIGDHVIAGTCYGRVKDLTDERGRKIKSVGPSRAATLLGLNGAPQAGDTFHVMDSEQEVRDIANKRLQLQREQGIRTQHRIGLEEIGARIAMGGVEELNIIVKGDVDGSVEALSDSLINLSTEKIQVNVIHKAVGQISENDIVLAAASNAIIIGFQVRPSKGARTEAEKQGVDIRLYSVIYDAIEEVKEAMEGLLKPIVKEEVTALVEVRQVYRISKVGLVAGAYVVDGKVSRTNKARLIRDGIVIFTGEINALKRFKDDVKEVSTNFECGISLTNCNDIREGDTIETYQEVEVRQRL
ncbi:MAG: translation initiation factor IF-2 [Bacteroidaceae bacterium]|nr:translation initiation factor IF-2 [Bacteroidaceae bacterium]